MMQRLGGTYNAHRHEPSIATAPLYHPSGCLCWLCRRSNGKRRLYAYMAHEDSGAKRSRHPFQLHDYPDVADILDGLEQLAEEGNTP